MRPIDVLFNFYVVAFELCCMVYIVKTKLEMTVQTRYHSIPQRVRSFTSRNQNVAIIINLISFKTDKR